MIGMLGLAATVLAAGTALMTMAAGVLVARRRWPWPALMAAVQALAGASVTASGLLVLGLVLDDFSIRYVADVGSRATPLLFTLSSLWGGLAGSLLFWASLLSLGALLLAGRTRPTDRGLVPVALVVLAALELFFLVLVLSAANPWGRVEPVPADGAGPNPLLREHVLMAVHPPLLYGGLVGLSLPFALTVGAFVRGSVDATWLRAARRWTLVPWVLLTAGLVTGAWWSYAVLGWGGYWAWDPVENMALLPWLTATAFLHSAIAGRGAALLRWNVLLVMASFLLTLLATLVTRSGMLESVHAFTRSPIGFAFLGLLTASLIGSLALPALRAPVRADLPPHDLRGRAFLLNNLLFATAALVVGFGTFLPIVAEAASGARISVGAPYFERTIGPIALGLLVLSAVGPTIGVREWTSTDRRPLAAAAVTAALVAIILVGLRADPEAIAGGAGGTFALVAAVVSGLRRVAGGQGPRARRLGGLTAHAGVAIIALAVVGTTAGRRETTVTLQPGATANLPWGGAIRYEGTNGVEDGGRTVVTAALRDVDSGAVLGPSLVVPAGSTAALATPAVRSSALGDLYVTLLDASAAGATLRAANYPLAPWLWAGGAITAAGGLLAAFPPLRRPARTASARVEATVVAGDGRA